MVSFMSINATATTVTRKIRYENFKSKRVLDKYRGIPFGMMVRSKQQKTADIFVEFGAEIETDSRYDTW